VVTPYIRWRDRLTVRAGIAAVSTLHRSGKIDKLDVARRCAAIPDGETGEVLEKTTAQGVAEIQGAMRCIQIGGME
jgi:hypothetical protein